MALRPAPQGTATTRSLGFLIPPQTHLWSLRLPRHEAPQGPRKCRGLTPPRARPPGPCGRGGRTSRAPSVTRPLTPTQRCRPSRSRGGRAPTLDLSALRACPKAVPPARAACAPGPCQRPVGGRPQLSKRWRGETTGKCRKQACSPDCHGQSLGIPGAPAGSRRDQGPTPPRRTQPGSRSCCCVEG